MDRLCSQCMRLSLRAERSAYHAGQVSQLRSFATSLQIRADEPSKEKPAGAIPINKAPDSQPKLLIRKTATRSPTPREGQVLRRTGPPSGNQPTRGAELRGAEAPQRPFLRRTGSPPQPGQILRRSGPSSQGGRPGQARQGKGPPGKMKRRRTAEDVNKFEEETEEASEEAVEEYMTKYIDRPANPTERLDYNPKPQEMVELEKDWPNTPMSTTGLSASMVQKIEWLARRLPHGYQTPQQLAENLQKGNLTRFESEEEKQEVLKVAKELAEKRAAKLSERKGSEVAAEDVGIVELSTTADKKMLVDQVVRGDFEELQRQRMPFLESITRNLRNNETYHKSDAEKFMATVQRLMPAQGQRRPQQGQKSA